MALPPTAVVVDGVGNADVQSDGEGGGLDVAEGLVQEQKMTLEQVLSAALRVCHFVAQIRVVGCG